MYHSFEEEIRMYPTMFLIDGRFNALTVLRVCGETALEGDGVIVLIGLAGKYEILLRGQLAV